MESNSQNISRYGAYAIIIQNERLLVILKKSGPYKGLWDLPGGAIEFGETPEMTVRREIEEETALEAGHPELLTVLTYHGSYFKDGKDSKFHHIGIIFQVNQTSLLPNRIPEEKIFWSPLQEMNSEELTPFAKQAYLNNFYRNGQEV